MAASASPMDERNRVTTNMDWSEIRARNDIANKPDSLNLDLLEIVRKNEMIMHHPKYHKSPLVQSLSEPSSPRKLYRARKATYANVDDDDTSSTGSSTTITSEDITGSRELMPSNTVHTHVNPPVPSLVVSQEDDPDSPGDFRQRSGSQFYHESFSGKTKGAPPSLYLPTVPSHQFTFNLKQKKQKSLLNRLRHSFNRHRPIVSDKGSHTKQRKWIDHEDELDPVSRPSYFRHIGHVIRTGPGHTHTIQLNRPPQGKFGIYVALGLDESNHDMKSVFVSRFYQESMSVFYGGLLQPGDEIVAINGRLVRDVPLSLVVKLLAGLETVQLTVLPLGSCQDTRQ